MRALFNGSDSRPIEAMMETLKEVRACSHIVPLGPEIWLRHHLCQELSDSSLGSTKGELFEMRLRELRHKSAAAPSNYHHRRRRHRNGARLLETSSSKWSRKSVPENSAAPQYFGTAASGSIVTKTKETIAGAGRTAGREAAPTKETPVERLQVGMSRNKGKMKEGYVEYNAAPAKHRIPTETHETGGGHRSNHNMATKRKDGPREDVIPVKHRVLVKAQSSKTRIPFPAAATTKVFSVGRSENKDGRAGVEDMMWAQRVKRNAATEVSHVHGAVTKVGRSMSSTRAMNMPVDTGTLKKATAKAGGSMSVSNGGSKRTKGGRR
ncbi:hypothetical protein BDN70DRAFT_159744 [Pholiota conissans]|uniref:Uncharacterized protein n=1 Tax=Pholiota conissans TaxID=109636 RepID=A0A9P5YWS5_9AGAR|nr:hypothetical protein BDN70DRAFT_159744 [Pholiota conissans]